MIAPTSEDLLECGREPINIIKHPAIFSPCRKYRYTLIRRWGDERNAKLCMFIGLNPSTADETQNDPTVTRCMNYARQWGYDGLIMTNLFAYRSTDPKGLKAVDDPVGSENDRYLLMSAIRASLVVAAWGNHGGYLKRDGQVTSKLIWHRFEFHALKRTKLGYPSHPLYLRADLRPEPLYFL